MLLRSGKPIVLAVNKMDSVGTVNPDFYEFYNLGLGDPIAVSAVHGHGTGDLLDECVAHFPPEEDEEYERKDSRDRDEKDGEEEDGESRPAGDGGLPTAVVAAIAGGGGAVVAGGAVWLLFGRKKRS